jgi:methylaspartate ammonia-lyase
VQQPSANQDLARLSADFCFTCAGRAWPPTCGGTCNETDLSARVCTHIAMACGAGQVLAKPGMGVDEGLMLAGNEMARVTALAQARTPR